MEWPPVGVNYILEKKNRLSCTEERASSQEEGEQRGRSLKAMRT
tara:strand:+ start:20 stop:151 length:132 start_codon:yes stop_codon:yes gene_type:complete